jgi:serine/threonine protein kinase
VCIIEDDTKIKMEDRFSHEEFVGRGMFGTIFTAPRAYSNVLQGTIPELSHVPSEQGEKFVIKTFNHCRLDDIYREVFFHTYLYRNMGSHIVPLSHWVCLIRDSTTGQQFRLDSLGIRSLHMIGVEDRGDYPLWSSSIKETEDKLFECTMHRENPYFCDEFWMAMPQLDGTFDDFLPDGPVQLSLMDSFDLALQLMRFIRDLHMKMFMMHGDIHSGNLMYRRDRETGKLYLFVVDFGRTRWISSSSHSERLKDNRVVKVFILYEGEQYKDEHGAIAVIHNNLFGDHHYTSGIVRDLRRTLRGYHQRGGWKDQDTLDILTLIETAREKVIQDG